MGKLFEVTVEFSYYVYANSQLEAEDSTFSREALSDSYDYPIYAREVKPRDSMLHGWERDYLVYHDGEDDLVLADVWPLDEEPEKPEENWTIPLFLEAVNEQ